MLISPGVAVLGVAIVLDLFFEEWPRSIHPVAWFGRVTDTLNRPWNRPRPVGLAIAVILPAVAALLLGGITELVIERNRVVGIVFAAVVLFSTVSLRMLVSTAREVIALSVTDLSRARTEVPALVGRDPTSLSVTEIRSAVIESLAENLADGFVAPLLGFALGAQVSVGVGVGVAVWAKAVNTLDSMLGYESEPLGWGPARLDDVVMWWPARVTAVLLALAALDPRSLSRARASASEPPSPNSGWPMATLAVVLDVTLVKPGAYRLHPDGRRPTGDDAHHAVRITGIAGGLAVLLAGGAVWF